MVIILALDIYSTVHVLINISRSKF